MPQVSQLTIFEGPDGAGKSTAAKKYAELTGARYVHFSSLPRVSSGLCRMYVEAMLPALHGHQPVVFDRSWLSEVPYGMAYREGHDRIGAPFRRMLERLALRCGAVLVKADPGWDTVVGNYKARKHLEMLDNEDQLREVYDLYAHVDTDLPIVDFNYHEKTVKTLVKEVEGLSTGRHLTEVCSVGSLAAIEYGVVLVGDGFAERKDQDAFYQWPFGSFSRSGCSSWLAELLERYEVSELELFWVNADQNLRLIFGRGTQMNAIALGDKASRALSDLDIRHKKVAHPQYHKRFASGARYDLINMIQKHLNG